MSEVAKQKSKINEVGHNKELQPYKAKELSIDEESLDAKDKISFFEGTITRNKARNKAEENVQLDRKKQLRDK
eukprot:16449972-Heterocapsa_arctica.AAC.1